MTASSEPSSDVIITRKRKRPRPQAVDPCLGYYFTHESSPRAEVPGEEDRHLASRKRLDIGKKGKEKASRTAVSKEPDKEKKNVETSDNLILVADSSDPPSEKSVTVEDFLQRIHPSSTKTYHRRRKRERPPSLSPPPTYSKDLGQSSRSMVLCSGTAISPSRQSLPPIAVLATETPARFPPPPHTRVRKRGGTGSKIRLTSSDAEAGPLPKKRARTKPKLQKHIEAETGDGDPRSKKCQSTTAGGRKSSKAGQKPFTQRLNNAAVLSHVDHPLAAFIGDDHGRKPLQFKPQMFTEPDRPISGSEIPSIRLVRKPIVFPSPVFNRRTSPRLPKSRMQQFTQLKTPRMTEPAPSISRMRPPVSAPARLPQPGQPSRVTKKQAAAVVEHSSKDDDRTSCPPLTFRHVEDGDQINPFRSRKRLNSRPKVVPAATAIAPQALESSDLDPVSTTSGPSSDYKQRVAVEEDPTDDDRYTLGSRMTNAKKRRALRPLASFLDELTETARGTQAVMSDDLDIPSSPTGARHIHPSSAIARRRNTNCL